MEELAHHALQEAALKVHLLDALRVLLAVLLLDGLPVFAQLGERVQFLLPATLLVPSSFNTSLNPVVVHRSSFTLFKQSKNILLSCKK